MRWTIFRSLGLEVARFRWALCHFRRGWGRLAAVVELVELVLALDLVQLVEAAVLLRGLDLGLDTPDLGQEVQVVWARSSPPSCRQA